MQVKKDNLKFTKSTSSQINNFYLLAKFCQLFTPAIPRSLPRFRYDPDYIWQDIDSSTGFYGHELSYIFAGAYDNLVLTSYDAVMNSSGAWHVEGNILRDTVCLMKDRESPPLQKIAAAKYLMSSSEDTDTLREWADIVLKYGKIDDRIHAGANKTKLTIMDYGSYLYSQNRKRIVGSGTALMLTCYGLMCKSYYRDG